MPFTWCSTVTTQACTPALAMAARKKKPKNISIGLVISSSRPDIAASVSCRRTWSTRMRLWIRIAATTGTPKAPSSITAPRQPSSGSSAAMTGGPNAKPRLPVKLCMAKERPIRSFGMEPLRIA